VTMLPCELLDRIEVTPGRGRHVPVQDSDALIAVLVARTPDCYQRGGHLPTQSRCGYSGRRQSMIDRFALLRQPGIPAE